MIKIVLELHHDHDNPPIAKRTLHRLAQGVQFSDVQPPDGVAVISLEHVNISLCVSRLPNGKKRRRIQRPHRVTQPSDTSALINGNRSGTDSKEDEPDDLFDLNAGCAAFPDGQTSLAFDDDDNEKILLDQSQHDAMLLEDDVENNINQPHVSLPGDREAHGPFCATSGKRSQSRCRSESSEKEECQQLCANQMADLIDAALRHSMTSEPIKVAAGIKVTSTESFARLSQIAPALWSPGHLPLTLPPIQAVSSRAVFLPTLSYALSHNVYAGARSSALRDKLEDLARQESSGVLGSCENDDGRRSAGRPKQEKDGLQKAVSVRLWQMMQRRLHDPQAARRLKPLQLATPGTQGDADCGADMLEFEGAANGTGGFDDLLDADGLFEVEDGAEWDELLDDGFLSSQESYLSVNDGGSFSDGELLLDGAFDHM
ncbi:hypothetical protein LTR28_004136 [Elasticomyces elasticus]|nr:hypothetical protein LTR28_004136 [Elasticomyces elasticus]